jgi:hypothetical protein
MEICGDGNSIFDFVRFLEKVPFRRRILEISFTKIQVHIESSTCHDLHLLFLQRRSEKTTKYSFFL